MASRIATTAGVLAVAAACALVGAAPAGAATTAADPVSGTKSCGTADYVYVTGSALSGTTRIYTGPPGGPLTLQRTFTGHASATVATGRHSASWKVTFTGPNGTGSASCR